MCAIGMCANGTLPLRILQNYKNTNRHVKKKSSNNSISIEIKSSS